MVKKDGRREPFVPEKVRGGIALACRKRPVEAEAQDRIVRDVEGLLLARRDEEVPSAAVGEAVMEALRRVDEVAYVRFASVYREFESVEQFVDTVGPLRSETEGS